mmetsp:Transcript_18682/g.50213  ORF Transcript_18682/g.50213 Transcript_18682/m.50213 type:complete len:295 (-) Transcript_18682:28-912(-)
MAAVAAQRLACASLRDVRMVHVDTSSGALCSSMDRQNSLDAPETTSTRAPRGTLSTIHCTCASAAVQTWRFASTAGPGRRKGSRLSLSETPCLALAPVLDRKTKGMWELTRRSYKAAAPGRRPWGEYMVPSRSMRSATLLTVRLAIANPRIVPRDLADGDSAHGIASLPSTAAWTHDLSRGLAWGTGSTADDTGAAFAPAALEPFQADILPAADAMCERSEGPRVAQAAGVKPRRRTMNRLVTSAAASASTAASTLAVPCTSHAARTPERASSRPAPSRRTRQRWRASLSGLMA